MFFPSNIKKLHNIKFWWFLQALCHEKLKMQKSRNIMEKLSSISRIRSADYYIERAIQACRWKDMFFAFCFLPVSKIRCTSYACESKQNIRENYSLKTHETWANRNIDHKNPYFLHAINLCFNFRHIREKFPSHLWKNTAFDIEKRICWLQSDVWCKCKSVKY